jgi:hypothetical protein
MIRKLIWVLIRQFWMSEIMRGPKDPDRYPQKLTSDRRQ